ncbi:MAG: hypothetical protein JKY22_03935 [Flavobacteriaceae bacterium]|nr:hypothetical protein [Flavobacteriaceae bacterium]
MSVNMVISKDVIAKRNSLARDIATVQDILHEFFPLANIGSLNSAISTLKNGKPILCPYQEIAPSFWGYKVSKLIFRLDGGVPRKMKPTGAVDLKLIVNIHVVGNCDYLGTMEDPLLWLAIDFKIEGDILKNDEVVKVFTCYHLDRHIVKKGDGETEPHPFYHFQYGGRHLVNADGGLDTGDLIVIETPRITHHPLDLILGLDYLISYFFPEKRKEIIRKSREYSLLLRKYQEIILKPYFHTLASCWNYDHQSIVSTNPLWTPISICPQIVS